jgi:uncharacterized protein DUF397
MTEHEKVIRPWRKSTFSQSGDCVEVAFGETSVLVRDSKDPLGGTLAFTITEWSAFLAGARRGEFDKS